VRKPKTITAMMKKGKKNVRDGDIGAGARQ
jgi:hypothetical protein